MKKNNPIIFGALLGAIFLIATAYSVNVVDSVEIYREKRNAWRIIGSLSFFIACAAAYFLYRHRQKHKHD